MPTLCVRITMKFLESLVAKMYITLIHSTKGFLVYAELRKNFKVIKRYEAQSITELEMLAKVVKKLERESSISYIALLETQAEQGFLPTCQAIEGVDLSSVEKVCVDQKWGFYISKDVLHDRQKSLKKVGLDFIFSPFTMMHQFHGESLQNDDGLAVLITPTLVLCSVYKEGVVIFAKETLMQEELLLVDPQVIVQKYVEVLQKSVQSFYDTKIDDAMFIEKVFIADGVGFESSFENQLEEELFVEVTKQSIDLSHELCILSEMELT